MKWQSKWQIFRIVASYIGCVTVGLCISVYGPSLLHLQYFYDTDTQTLANCFLAQSVGYGLGCFLCGATFDRFNRDILLAMAEFYLGITTMFLLWMPNVYVFIAAAACSSIFVGFLEPAFDAYLISNCPTGKIRKPVLCGLHAMWSLGVSLTPLMLRPFLSDLPTATDNKACLNQTFSTPTPGNLSSNYCNEYAVDVEILQYAYFPIGLTCCIPGCLFLVAFIQSRTSRNNLNQHGLEAETRPEESQELETKGISNIPEGKFTEEKDSPKANARFQCCHIKFAIMTLLLGCYFFHQWCVAVPLGYLTKFSSLALNWQPKDATFILTLFWILHGLSRISAIAVSIILSPAQMTFLYCGITLSGFALMVFVRILPELFMWISAGMAAFGIGSTFASMFLWFSDRMVVTGLRSALIFLFTILGYASSTIVVGYTIDSTTPMVFVYVCLGSVTCNIALFLILLKIGHDVKSEINMSFEITVDKEEKIHLNNNELVVCGTTI